MLFSQPTNVASLALIATLACANAEASELSSSDVFGDKTDVYLGFGVRYAPQYMGSDEFATELLPLVSIERGIFFVDSLQGVGVQFATDSGFRTSAALGYDFGRNDRDSSYRDGSDHLRGMGDIDGATVLNVHAEQDLSTWLAVYGEANLRVAGEDRGNKYKLGVLTTLLDSGNDKLTFDFGAHAGDGQYNQNFFGVTGTQSLASGLHSFKADNDIYAYSSNLTLEHSFSDQVSAFVNLDITHYTDQVRNSPVIEKATPASASVGLGYEF